MKRKFMSTGIKILLLILILLTIIFYSSGCIILANSGYKFSNYSNEINKLNFNYTFDFNHKISENRYSINNNIKDIEISLVSQDLNINEYDGDDILVQIKNNKTSNCELSTEENENKLILSSNHSIPSHSLINISIPKKIINNISLKLTNNSGEIGISDLNLKSLTTFTSSGEIQLSNLNLKYLSLNSSSGDINLNNINSSETKVNSVSGDIQCNGNFGDLYTSSTSSDIDFTFENSLKNSSLGSISGCISLNIPKQCGYKINYYTISGEINSSKLSNGNEEAIIDIKTTSGDISIN